MNWAVQNVQPMCEGKYGFIVEEFYEDGRPFDLLEQMDIIHNLVMWDVADRALHQLTVLLCLC